MKSIFKTSTLLIFAILLLTACESYPLQAFKDSITTQAKNAVDVLPADVAFVGMINTQDLKENEYTDLFGANGLLKNHAPQEGLAHLEDFIAMTGFDLNEDLDEVYVAVGEITKEQKAEASIVAYAAIDPEQLQNYVKDQIGDELDIRAYRGVDIFEGNENHGPSFSFVNTNMIIAATNTDLLEDMIDRLEGKGTPLSSNAAMMDLVARASAGESGWFVAQKPPDASLKTPDNDNEPDNKIAQSAVQIWSALDYVVGALNIESQGLDSQVFLYPRADVSADDLSSLMNGLIAAAKANPELDEKDLKMLDDVRAKSSGDHVSIELFVENSMIKMIKG